MAKEKVKSNAVVTATWNDDDTKLTLVVKDAGEIVFDTELAVHLMTRAACHGFEQRLRDRAAMSADTKTGISASPLDKFNRIKALVDHYHGGGEWEMRGAGGGKKAEIEWILEALAAIKGTDVDAMRGKVEVAAANKGLTVDKYLKQVATVEAVALKVAQLKFGDQEAKVDLDELSD